MDLTRVQREVRQKLVAICLKHYKEDYHLTDEDIAGIFSSGFTKQAVAKVRNNMDIIINNLVI